MAEEGLQIVWSLQGCVALDCNLQSNVMKHLSPDTRYLSSLYIFCETMFWGWLSTYYKGILSRRMYCSVSTSEEFVVGKIYLITSSPCNVYVKEPEKMWQQWTISFQDSKSSLQRFHQKVGRQLGRSSVCRYCSVAQLHTWYRTTKSSVDM